MRTIENQAEDAVLNGLSAFLGIALFLAPWYLDLGSETAAARNAFACGATIAVVAMLALSQSYDWEEYLTLAIGLWVVAAPWALGFAEMRSPRRARRHRPVRRRPFGVRALAAVPVPRGALHLSGAPFVERWSRRARGPSDCPPDCPGPRSCRPIHSRSSWPRRSPPAGPRSTPCAITPRP
jgi:hypothetical protein